MGIQEPPVGPDEKTRLTLDCAVTGSVARDTTSAKSSARTVTGGVA
jgi:hypothetical protein